MTGTLSAVVFDLGGGVPLRLSLREAENAQRVRGFAATAAGDGTAEKPVALAAWIAAASNGVVWSVGSRARRSRSDRWCIGGLWSRTRSATSRSRSSTDFSVASLSDSPCARCCWANSTIRMAFFAASPTSTIRPTCTKMSRLSPTSRTPATALSTLIGTTRMIASGSPQLSYCAASTR